MSFPDTRFESRRSDGSLDGDRAACTDPCGGLADVSRIGGVPSDAVDPMREQLVERERWLLQPGPSTDVGALLSAEFGEIGASGRRWDRASALALVEGRRGQGVGEYELSEIDCRALGTTTYLLTYAIETPQARTRRTSIWEWRDGRWQLVHHQGTRVPEEESG